MPYRLKFDESAAKGFRRITREQLDLAIAELSKADAPPSAVHESRKALKRTRAVIRCFAPAMGVKVAHQHVKALGAIARKLSGRRDADVALETVVKLESQFGSEGVSTLLPLRDVLRSNSGAAGAEPLDENALEAIQLLLTKERSRLAKVKIKGRGGDRVMQGIEDSYRKGRKSLHSAYGAPSDKAFHDLRKGVQTHWRQMALLSRAWPEEFAVRVAAARELSQVLGDDHDIALLKYAAGSLPADQQRPIKTLCEKRQSELRAAVHDRVQRLFAERPAAFGARMAALWTSGRRITQIEPPVADAQAEPAKTRETAASQAIGSPPRLAAKTLVPSPSQRRA
jgi:CHAD domain-containing protein